MKKSYGLAVVGLALLGVGLYLIKAVSDPQGFLRALPYVCVGVGCGVFGHGVGDLISRRAMKNSPDLERQLEIEKQDERNIAISRRAKAKAYDSKHHLASYTSIDLLFCEMRRPYGNQSFY